MNSLRSLSLSGDNVKKNDWVDRINNNEIVFVSEIR